LKFDRKRVVFISARVHPGEVPSSHIMHGILAYLSNTSDPQVMDLLHSFVFKIVPIINPDGVAKGHYRLDSLGQNLNRYYDSPDPFRQPTIFAIKQYLLYLN
jgi:murein tripeptide amidase MpaA